MTENLHHIENFFQKKTIATLKRKKIGGQSLNEKLSIWLKMS